MITTLRRPPSPLPKVARLGFDDGWLLLPPTFLNLRVPVMVVDHAYIGDPRRFGLQPFGACDPNAPLPMADLVVSSRSGVIIIQRKATTEIVASVRLHVDRAMSLFSSYPAGLIIIGSTYELESTWAALWTMSIGRVKLTNQEESNEYC